MKYLSLIIGLTISSIIISCEDKECPDGMEDCTLNNGSEICVPEGTNC